MMNPSVQIPWLPLSKAADKITQMTGKLHSEADLLDAALDCRLSLSVQVPSLGIFARRGQFQSFGDDAPFGVSTNVRLQYAENGVAVTSTRSPFVPKIIEDAFFAYSTEEGDYVRGLFDLLLIGNGRAHIENLSKGYRGDCELTPLLPCGGVYLEGANGAVWEVQEGVNDVDEFIHLPAEQLNDDCRVVVRSVELDRLAEQRHEAVRHPAKEEELIHLDGINQQIEQQHTIEATTAGELAAEQGSTVKDRVIWKWSEMKHVAKMDRKTIINRAGWLGIEFRERAPKHGSKNEKGLLQSDLQRVKTYTGKE